MAIIFVSFYFCRLHFDKLQIVCIPPAKFNHIQQGSPSPGPRTIQNQAAEVDTNDGQVSAHSSISVSGRCTCLPLAQIELLTRNHPLFPHQSAMLEKLEAAAIQGHTNKYLPLGTSAFLWIGLQTWDLKKGQCHSLLHNS